MLKNFVGATLCGGNIIAVGIKMEFIGQYHISFVGRYICPVFAAISRNIDAGTRRIRTGRRFGSCYYIRLQLTL